MELPPDARQRMFTGRRRDFSFDYDQLASTITDKTRAIFLAHLLGFPADIERIKKIIGDRSMQLFEDCCESHGATVAGSKVGNHGAGGTFSFYWGHDMTTVEGDVVCTNDEAIYRACVLERSHGLARELPESYHADLKAANPDIDFRFLFITDSLNFRNTRFNALLGLASCPG